MIKGPVIFKRDEAGKVRVWQFYVDGANFGAISGVEGGKQVVSKPKTAKPKSKATAELQALFEAEAMMVKKIRIEYHENRVDIDKPGLKPFLPMLAHPYVVFDAKTQKPTYTTINFPVYSQPKFDGMRSVLGIKGAFSREGKEQVAHPHIVNELLPLVRGAFQFDGELYNHALKDDFNEIISIFRKTKVNPEILEQSRKLGQYHIYDCYVKGLAFKDRLFLLQELFKSNPIHYSYLTETILCHNQEELDDEYARLLGLGYEGQIIRYPDEVYVPNQRQPHLVVKRKEFITEEFEIEEILEGEGNWQGAAKKVRVRLEDDQTCEAGMNGDFGRNAKILLEKDEYVGGQATIRYLNRTPDNSLRGPVVIDLFKGERDY